MAHMTDEEYVQTGGGQCPECKSHNIASDGPYEGDSDWVSLPVICNNCNYRWDDVYKLAGYTSRD